MKGVVPAPVAMPFWLLRASMNLRRCVHDVQVAAVVHTSNVSPMVLLFTKTDVDPAPLKVDTW
ncbi:MAG: hypothetical protein IPJ65_38085 [Archangiaceae bacterium]|nr:hypothetical protein [Archangiaceae bacterium]